MERWAMVDGFEGLYMVSTLGRVRSLDRIVPNRYSNASHRRGRILKPTPDRRGYLQVNLSKNNSISIKKVHRLVAFAFLGQPPKEKSHVNHKNFEVSDNTLSNLEWISPRDNTAHAAKGGRFDAALSPRRAKKLSIDAVIQIREAKANGESSKDIASRFSIARETVDKIISGKIWIRA